MTLSMLTIEGTWLDISAAPLARAVTMTAMVQTPADHVISDEALNRILGLSRICQTDPDGMARVQVVKAPGAVYRVDFGGVEGHLRCDDWDDDTTVPFVAIKDVPGGDPTPIGAAGGGLTGTYPNPTVAAVRGVTVSDTAPTAGQVLTASSGTAAAWTTPPLDTLIDGAVEDYLTAHPPMLESLQASPTPGLLAYTRTASHTPVTALSDDFSTAGEVVGSTPDVGPVWTGTTGVWSSTSGLVTSAAPGGLAVDAGARDLTVSASYSMVTQATGSGQIHRLYASAMSSVFTTCVWIGLSVSGTGTVTVTLWKTIAGTSTQLATIPTTGITVNSASPQAISLTLVVDDDTVTATLGDATVTATLSTAERDALGSLVGVQSMDAAGQPGLRLDSILVTHPDTTPPTSETIPTSDSAGNLAPVVLGRLDTRYAALGTYAPSPSALERLRTLKAMAVGTVRLAVVSDSTANDVNDWVRIWVQKFGASLPASVRCVYNSWDATASAWRAAVVDAPGAAPDYGVTVDDDFSTAGEVVGSTPDVGPVWTGSTAPGWASDGALATLSGSAPKSISANLGSKDQTVRVTFSLVTTAQSAAQLLRIYAGSNVSGLSYGAWASLSISVTGALTIALYKTFGGTSTLLVGSTSVAGVTSNSGTPQAVTVELTTSIQNVTAKVTAPGGQVTTITGTLTESDVSALGTFGGVMGLPSASFSYGYRLDSIHMDTPLATSPAQPVTLEVWNGAIAGAGLSTFDAAKRAAMFGGKGITALILATGHNNGGQPGTEFTAQTSAFIKAMQDENPGLAGVVVSQNPQFPPSSMIAPHRERQAALRVWAKDNRVDYVGGYEAFAAQPDGGVSLVLADGIHPTTPPSGLTGAYGSVLWADAFNAATS